MEKPATIIKYDTPIQVTEIQYNRIMRDFAGSVAGRNENGVYFIKVWFMKYAGIIEKYLTQ